MNTRHTAWILLKVLTTVVLTLLIVFTDPEPANAAVITGEKPLAGISYMINLIIEKSEDPDPEDVRLLAEVMFHENYVNGDECMLLTGSVVLNRVKDNTFPDTIEKVLYQKHPLQYSTTEKFFREKIPEHVYQLAEHLLIFGSIAPDNVVYQAMRPQGSGVYRRIPSSYAPDKDIEYFCYK